MVIAKTTLRALAAPPGWMRAVGVVTAEFRGLAGTPGEPRVVRAVAAVRAMAEVLEAGAPRKAECQDSVVLAMAVQAKEAKEKAVGVQPWCGYPRGSASTRPR